MHGDQVGGGRIEAGHRKVSRSGIVKAAALGVVGLAAAGVAEPDTAAAAQGGNMLIGVANTGATAPTSVTTTTGEELAVFCTDPTDAQYGRSGVYGEGRIFGAIGIATYTGAEPGAGVLGLATASPDGVGVKGVGFACGVEAGAATTAANDGGSGVNSVGGQTLASGHVGGHGVVSQGGDGPGGGGAGVVASGGPTAGTGVIATGGSGGVGVSATGNGGGHGVVGVGADGDGVHGSSTTGAGVCGTSQGGPGMFGVSGGISSTAIGVHGQSSGKAAAVMAEHTAGGLALMVTGIASFSRSGSLHFPAGAASKAFTLAGVTVASLVLATLQKDAAGCCVQSAVPRSGRFTINLNQPAPAGGLDVAWLVLN